MPSIMVTGSRHWDDSDAIYYALLEAFRALGSQGSTVLLSGHCPTGADKIAEDIWEGQGFPIRTFPADWTTWGRKAGPIRNQEMIDTMPDIVLAFPLGSSPGTRGTIKMAEDAGLDTRIYGGN